MTLSINTNTASMAALQSLSATSDALTKTEGRISSGKKIDNAADSPAIFSITSSMTGNINGLSAVSDSLSFGSQVLNTATTATKSILTTLQNLQTTVTQAGQSGIDLATMQKQVADAVNSINTYARNATFNGVNILTTSADGTGSSISNLNIVQNVQGQMLSISNVLGDGSTDKTFAQYLGLSSGTEANATGTPGNLVIGSGTDAAATPVQLVLTATGPADASGNKTIQASDITTAVSTIQTAITKLSSVSQNLGNNQNIVSGLQTYTTGLSDALTTGVGALTDADLSAESAKLTSLQTKQQLAIQSLSIANSSSQNILSLFRG